MFHRIGLLTLVAILAIANLSLLSTYNIFVGDDGYLASYLYEYHFTGSRNFVLCHNWPIHQFLIATLGPAYRWAYAADIALIEWLGIPYHYINVLSAALFIATLGIFAATISHLERRWVVLSCIVIFGTLEPFLVMSHSIRTEALIMLALAIAIWGLVRNGSKFRSSLMVSVAPLVIVNSHLGGWPLIVGLGVGILYLRGFVSAAIYAGSCTVASVIYLVLNDLTSIDAIRDLIALYGAQGSISGFSRTNVLNDVVSHFIDSKYMRNVIELIIVVVFLASAIQWPRLGRVSRALIVTTISSLISYVVVFSYINPYYLVYFYYLMLVTIAWCGNELLSERPSFWIAPVFTAPFALLFLAIFAMFARSPGWDLLVSNKDRILQLLPDKGVVAAPEYFAHVDPVQHRSFVPISQASPRDGCVKEVSAATDFSAIVADTRRLDLAAPLLSNFRLVERIRIGRLATQTLSDQGELLVYVRK